MDTGSFGAATGGMTPELQAAVQRRAGSSSIPPTSQVTNSAPTATPSTPMMTPPAGGPVAQSPSTQPNPSMGISGNGAPFDSTEAKAIIGALSNRLKALSTIQGA